MKSLFKIGILLIGGLLIAGCDKGPAGTFFDDEKGHLVKLDGQGSAWISANGKEHEAPYHVNEDEDVIELDSDVFGTDIYFVPVDGVGLMSPLGNFQKVADAATLLGSDWHHAGYTEYFDEIVFMFSGTPDNMTVRSRLKLVDRGKRQYMYKEDSPAEKVTVKDGKMSIGGRTIAYVYLNDKGGITFKIKQKNGHFSNKRFKKVSNGERVRFEKPLGWRETLK